MCGRHFRLPLTFLVILSLCQDVATPAVPALSSSTATSYQLKQTCVLSSPILSALVALTNLHSLTFQPRTDAQLQNRLFFFPSTGEHRNSLPGDVRKWQLLFFLTGIDVLYLYTLATARTSIAALC